jgi:phage terminase large subunit-like protein
MATATITRANTSSRVTVAEQYIADVLSGKQVVSTWVRKMIERHQSDLAAGHLRSLRFDREHALKPIRFIQGALKHTSDSGKAIAGATFKLEPWQQAFIWILFGWRRIDTGQRRFRTAYCELARGNGKSKLASAIALYVLVGEGVQGAEVYSVATHREQAKIVFDDSCLMAASSPALDMLVEFRNNLHVPGTACKYMPLASEESTLDGLKPNLVVVDELHAHKNKGVWTKCKTAMGKKPGSIMLAITTAGHDRHSVCFEQRDYSERVLDGFEDDSYFAWICCTDKDDDPFDEANWIKSNPNLDVSIELQTLRDAAKQARMIPTEYSEFLRMRCNIWTQVDTAWMPNEAWSGCGTPVDAEALKGRPCFGGLDLSSTEDTTSFVLLFPPYGNDSKWSVLPFFFLPEENILQRARKDRVPYDVWSKRGLFDLTPGNVVDYGYLRTKINLLAEQYDIREIAFDRWNAQAIVTQLEDDGHVMAKIGQGYETLNAPMKFLMELVLRKELAHGNHPVLLWQAGNVMAAMDPAGNIKPDKSKSRERIDGIAALIDALERAQKVPIKPKVEFEFFTL